MAKVEITVPGERIVNEFTALVPQPTSPSTAKAPDVGLVEISYVNPTELVPGPPGPPGQRGSRWYTGDGDPTITGALLGDMYLDDATGKIWVWNGTAWVDTGTDLSPDASELLTKIKTVDGAGSGLDADLLDGQNGTWYLDRVNHTGVQAISTVTGLQPALDLKAPLASPALTGNPTAPTPTAGDADTSIATTAFVTSAVTTSTVPPATVLPLMDGAAAVGTVAKYAKEDHRHPSDTTKIGDAPNDGLTYGRRSATWATIVGGAVVGDAAPGAPLQNGQLWYKSNSGDTFIYVDDGNSTQWVQQNVLPQAQGSLLSGVNVTVINTLGAGTYTKPAGLKYLEVTCVGGGGGSGSCTSATGAGVTGATGGAGGGGTCFKFYVASAVPATVAYTVGAGGTATSTGGTTTFNTMSAGGGGGTVSMAVGGLTMSDWGFGGAASGGDINIVGGPGGAGVRAAHGSNITALGGESGRSSMAPGIPGSVAAGGGSRNGIPGLYPGGGAAGAVMSQNSAQCFGAAGAQGCIILKEYL